MPRERKTPPHKLRRQAAEVSAAMRRRVTQSTLAGQLQVLKRLRDTGEV